MASILGVGEQKASWHTRVGTVAVSQAQVTGILAGFSITVIAILSTLTEVPAASLKQTVGLFVITLLALVGASVIYSLVDLRGPRTNYLLYSLSNSLFSLGVVLMFCGLDSLTKLIKAEQGSVLRVMIFGTAAVGYFLAAVPLRDLFRMHVKILAFLSLLAAALGYICFRMTSTGAGSNPVILLLPYSVVVAAIFAVCVAAMYSDTALVGGLATRITSLIVYLAVATLVAYAAMTFGGIR